jgi:hypothetical protein
MKDYRKAEKLVGRSSNEPLNEFANVASLTTQTYAQQMAQLRRDPELTQDEKKYLVAVESKKISFSIIIILTSSVLNVIVYLLSKKKKQAKTFVFLFSIFFLSFFTQKEEKKRIYSLFIINKQTVLFFFFFLFFSPHAFIYFYPIYIDT